LLAAAIAFITAHYSVKPTLLDAEEDGSVSPVAKEFSGGALAPPPELLGHAARMPTPEELEDEAHFRDLKVARASEWINSPLAEKRLSGVEQLSAYPTPESQQILASTLILDVDPDVRKTAAQRLSRFKQPTDDTVAALLTALEDESEGVQMSALNTLQGMAARMQRASPQAKSLLASIKQIAASSRSAALTRQAMFSFLKDQEISPLPAFGMGN
jgi:HEAT repeat protein